MQKSGFVARKCLKCGGSVYLDRDQFGWFEQCLQCGFVSDLKDLAKTGNARVEQEIEKIAAMAE
jgi:hypothetical protein